MWNEILLYVIWHLWIPLFSTVDARQSEICMFNKITRNKIEMAMRRQTRRRRQVSLKGYQASPPRCWLPWWILPDINRKSEYLISRHFRIINGFNKYIPLRLILLSASLFYRALSSDFTILFIKNRVPPIFVF